MLAAWLLAGRALHDAHYRGVRIRGHRLIPRGPQQPPERHAERARELVARLPARTIERLASDAGMPRWLAEPFAARTLERKGAARYLRAAAAHRGERSKWRRIAALRVLCAAGHPRALALLETALMDGDPDVVAATVSLLGAQPARKAAELLVHALRHRMHSHSRVAARLDHFALDVSDLLLPLAADADPVVRFWGATLLARYGPSPIVVAALELLAHDGDAAVRKAAIESLGVAGGPFAADVALTLLEDPSWFVRAHAARALGDLERADLAPRVLPLLADREWWVRTAAKDALQAMGRAVAPAVTGVLDHPDRFARNGAAEVLQNLGVLDEIAARAARGEADPGERALLAKAQAAEVEVAPAGHVRRILPALSDRMRAAIAAVPRGTP